MSIEVSVVTPTYNRRPFISTLISVYKNQSYPKEKMEWIIIDDGKDSVEDLFMEASKTIPNIRYIYKDEKMNIGEKRNLLNKEAKGQIIVSMDDDDYYPKDRVSTVVEMFEKYPRVDLAGASEMFMYYTDTKKVYSIGPYHSNHATNGTMAWRKRYADKHKYDVYVTKAEEVSFLDNYKYPMIQLDPKKTIVVICHTDNTVDKNDLRETHSILNDNAKEKMRTSVYSLKDLVKEKEILSFYTGL
jgi:glycosyltransferase involved in cell wall biosynthesis